MLHIQMPVLIERAPAGIQMKKFIEISLEILLNALRDYLGLIGAKRGCDSGGRGCCTVHIGR